MESFERNEKIIRYSIAGFFMGLVIPFLVVLTLFLEREQSFTFQALWQLHREIALLFLLDSAPFIGAYLAFRIGRTRIRELDRFNNLILTEDQKKQVITGVINDLTLGKLNTDLSDVPEDGSIRTSLASLQQTLRDNRTGEQERRREEQQRNWVSEGVAEFGDILRKHSSDLESMAYAVISRMVRYLEANQGGFFLEKADEKEHYFDLIACHAWDRKKFPDKRIKFGDGLIGAVGLEKKSYYTDKIPDSYLSITSGLGKANPRYLLIVPMVVNDRIFGVLELASFNPLPDYKIHFVERVAVNTATTLSIMESNMRTEQLLKETQAQAQKLAQQEEQVRQNIEELKSTQAEAARQAEKFISFTNSVNHTLIRAEYDTDGILLYANTKFLKKLGYSGNKEVEGKHISMFINNKDREWFDEIWKKLAGGGKHFEGYMKHITKMGQDLWTMATYTCVRQEDGSVEKILFLAIDTTEQKQQSLDFEGQIEAINRLSPKAEFTPDGKLLTCNQLFLDSLKYSDNETRSMNVFDFIVRSDQERFNEIWEQVIRGKPYQGQLRLHSRYEEELWFRITFTAVNDMYDEVEKVIFLANEISKEREMEMAARRQHEELKKKEEEMKLQSLDLQKKLEETEKEHEKNLTILGREKDSLAQTIDQLPMPLVTINNMGYILLINKAAEKHWKIRRNTLLHHKVTDLFDENQSSELMRAFVDPARAKEKMMQEQVEIRLPGNRTEEGTVSMLRTEAGDEVYASLLLHNP